MFSGFESYIFFFLSFFLHFVDLNLHFLCFTFTLPYYSVVFFQFQKLKKKKNANQELYEHDCIVPQKSCTTFNGYLFAAWTDCTNKKKRKQFLRTHKMRLKIVVIFSSLSWRSFFTHLNNTWDCESFEALFCSYALMIQWAARFFSSNSHKKILRQPS